MSGKIIRPQGDEIMKYLNDEYPICNECGALMDEKEDPTWKNIIYVCPACGWKVDQVEYEYDYGEEVEWTDEILKAYDGDVPPAGCIACGGPYPQCKTSCKLFDD